MEELAIKLISKGFTKLASAILGKKGNEVLTDVGKFLGINKDSLKGNLDNPVFIDKLHKYELTRLELVTKDIQDSRATYVKKGGNFVDSLAKTTIWLDTISIFLILGSIILVMYFKNKLNLDSNTVTAIIGFASYYGGKLSEQLSQVYTFYYGSSLFEHKNNGTYGGK